MLKGLIVGVLICVCLAGFSGWYFYQFLVTPGPNFSHTVLFFVHERASLQATADQLAAEKLITSAQLFSWWARYTGADRKIRSGEYLFTRPLSPLAILDILTSGGLKHVVTITEGMSFRQIAALLAAKGL